MGVTLFFAIYFLAYIPAILLLGRRLLASAIHDRRALALLTVGLIALPVIDAPITLISYVMARTFGTARYIGKQGYHPKELLLREAREDWPSGLSFSKDSRDSICGAGCIKLINTMVTEGYSTKFVWFFQATSPELGKREKPFDWNDWNQYASTPIIAPKTAGYYAVYPSDDAEYCDAFFEAKLKYAEHGALDVFSRIHLDASDGHSFRCIAFKPISSDELVHIPYKKTITNRGGPFPFTYRKTTYVIATDAKGVIARLYSTASIEAPWFLQLDSPVTYHCGSADLERNAVNFVGG